MKADLHIHTSSSDGLLSIDQVIEKARSGGLAVISITDHDNANAYDYFSDDEIRQEISTDDSGIFIVPGIEISCDFMNEEIHVLGYFIKPASPVLQELEIWMRTSRKQRLAAMQKKLKHLEMPLTEDEILAYSKGAPIGRPHIAAALCAKGYCATFRDAFDNYLVKGKPIYCEREKPSIEMAVEIIHSAGGIAFLAHPGLILDSRILADVMKKQFDGIEVWHNSHDKRTSDYLYSFCMNNNKLMSGGSDFHGMENSASLGEFAIDTRVVEKMILTIKAGNECNLIFHKFVDTCRSMMI